MFAEVSIEATTGLEREMTVTVSVENLEREIARLTADYAQNAKIDGFRKGRVPQSIIQKRFGESIREEAAQKLIKETLPKAFEDNKLQVVGMPTIKSMELSVGQPLKYKVSFEIMPVFELKTLKGTEIEQTTVDITEEDVTNFIEKIRRQHPSWIDIERPAKNEDRLLIDFKGFIDDQPFANGAAEDFWLELGSQQFVPGFEDGLIGATAESEREVKLTFPIDYHAELAGKEVTFAVKIKKIQEKKLADLDDEFAAKFNIEEGGMAKMREEIHRQIKRLVDVELQKMNQNVVLEKLLEFNSFDVPQVLITEEVQHLQQTARKNLANRLGKKEKEMPLPPPDLFQEKAQQQVKSQLIFQKIIADQKIKLDTEKVWHYLQDFAEAYENPTEIINNYKQNPKKYAEIENKVFEIQLFETLLNDANVIKKVSCCDDIINAAKD